MNVIPLLKPKVYQQIHYAWIILAVGFGLQAISAAMRLAFGTFVEPLAETYAWDKGSIGLAYAIQFVSSAIFAPIAGWLGEVYGVRRTLYGGVVLFTLGMVLTGTMTELWQFYLYYGVIVGGAISILAVPLVASVTYWFKTRQGLAVGILMSSLGVGPFLAAPVLVYLIMIIGWGLAIALTGAASGLIMLALVTRFYRSPADRNMRPYGAGDDEPVAPKSDRTIDKARAVAFFQRARGTLNFWNLVNIHFLGCVGHSIIIVYATSIAIQRGIEPILAAGVVSIFAAISIFTRFLTPLLSDHKDPKILMAVSYGLQGATVFMLLGADTVWEFYLFAVIFGLGYGGEGSIFPLLNRRYYPDAPVGTAYGWQMFGAGFGMALGGWTGGYLFDLTGTYTLTIIISAAASLGGMVSILRLANPHERLIPDWSRRLAGQQQPT